MLVLTRKQGEQLQIGDNITITLLAVRGGGMKIGIQAPDNVRILRGELDSFREPAPRVARRRPRVTAISA